jgi:glutamate-ammonia-ligase adenylyltransferase
MPDSLPEILVHHQQERWTTFCDEARSTGIPFSPTSAAAKALATAFGFSEFVAASCIRHPRMAVDLIDSDDLFNTYNDGHMAVRLAPAAPIGGERPSGCGP